MKLLDFFRRSPRAARDQANWTIVRAHNPDTGQAAIFRARFSKPARADVATLTTAIVIKWAYESPNQMPPNDVNRAQVAFETAVEALAAAENSELVHVSTGMGLKEWIFYARSRDAYMADFNKLLVSHPSYPLQIEFFDDPEWKVWSDLVDPLRTHDD